MSNNWPPREIEIDDHAREPRTSKLVSLELTGAGNRRVKFVVRNMSSHGVSGRGEVDLLPCERVRVHMADGRDIAGTVRWVKQNTFGIALDEKVIDAARPVAPGAKSAAIVPRDAALGFQPLRHTATANRSGFQRTHREEVLRQSDWRGVDKD